MLFVGVCVGSVCVYLGGGEADHQRHRLQQKEQHKVEEIDCAGTDPQHVYDILCVLSLAWSVLAGRTEANPYGVGLSDVIREHERWISVYGECVGAQRQRQLQTLVPLKYLLAQPLPQGKYAAETPRMEQLEPDGYSILGAQYGRENPVAYRVLPFIDSFKPLIPTLRKRVLIDAGAASFSTGGRRILDLYSGTLRFTHAFLIDPERIEDMPAKNLVEQELNVTQYQRLLRVGTRQPESDLISMITGEAWDLDESDFVVLKFDCDLDVHKSSLEWGFLADLVYTPEALRLVDEIFIEMHFFYPSLWQDKFHSHTMWQHFDVLRQLRTQGIAVHAWP